MATNWSDLPEELLERISDRVFSHADRLCFAAVCRSWRSALEAIDGRRPRPRAFLPYLVLSDQEQEGRSSSGRLCLVDLSDQKVRRGLRFPSEAGGWSLFGLCHSWLGMMDESDASARLLDPFTGDVVGLPPLTDAREGAGPSSTESWFPLKLCLSSPDPASDPSCVAVVIRGYTHRLAYALPGRHRPWLVLDHPRIRGYDDVVYHRGSFYAISKDGIVVAADVITGSGSRGGRRDGPRLGNVRIVARLRWRYVDGRLFLSVLPDGGLVVVRMKADYCGDAVGNRVSEVGKIDMVSARSHLVGSLGDCALFLGCSCSVSIRASQVEGGGCREDSIYFADDCRVTHKPSAVRHRVEVFGLDDGSVQQLYPRKGNSSLIPPTWMVPKPWQA